MHDDHYIINLMDELWAGDRKAEVVFECRVFKGTIIALRSKGEYSQGVDIDVALDNSDHVVTIGVRSAVMLES